ncbi:MAG: phytanoyl-CoA dioxygenase family protein [Armatimonadetes bacterium]|nr:phytanoyl-CoA dioxygenase family protein [Armatimonadota bacterium]
MEPIFHPYAFGAEERERMDRDGHLALPGLLTDSARERLTEALSQVLALEEMHGSGPQRYSAEWNAYLASLIAHPQLLELARAVLGPEIRYDHCVALNRPPGNHGIGWHSHGYGEASPDLGFVRIFFYVNGFTGEDGALAVVPGSHLFRDPGIRAASDEELRGGWMAGEHHPHSSSSDAPLEIETLSAPEGTVILMWTHAAHAVRPRKPDSFTRWAVVYAYRNPGEPSRARWISEEFERTPPEGTERLMSLY